MFSFSEGVCCDDFNHNLNQLCLYRRLYIKSSIGAKTVSRFLTSALLGDLCGCFQCFERRIKSDVNWCFSIKARRTTCIIGTSGFTLGIFIVLEHRNIRWTWSFILNIINTIIVKRTQTTCGVWHGWIKKATKFLASLPDVFALDKPGNF